MPVAALEPTGLVLADHVTVASGAVAMRGLLGRESMAPGDGLYLPDALFGAIHSIGMCFPFDALYLDRRGLVRCCLRTVRPGRLCRWDLWTVAVLELPAGAADAVHVGDRVTIRPGGDAHRGDRA